MAFQVKHADRIRSVLHVRNRLVDKILDLANLVSTKKTTTNWISNDRSDGFNTVPLRKHLKLPPRVHCISVDDP